MVEGEARNVTKQRIHKLIELIYNECQDKYLTLDDMVVIFREKYELDMKKPAINKYLQAMKEELEFSTKSQRVKFANLISYKVVAGQTLDLQKIWPIEYNAPTVRHRTLDDYFVKFDPPRNQFISKLFGLPVNRSMVK